MRRSGDLTGETLSGITVSFTYDAYIDAMHRYSLQDIEAIVIQIEDEAREKSGITGFLEKFGIARAKADRVPEEVAHFFRDFCIIQETDHPDFDRGNAIGSLATRIELATGEVTAQQVQERGIDLQSDRGEYEQIFG
jgi:hypothetical protein